MADSNESDSLPRLDPEAPIKEFSDILREHNQLLDGAIEKSSRLLIGLHAGGVALIATLSGVFTSRDISEAKPLILSAIPFVVGLAAPVIVAVAKLDWLEHLLLKNIRDVAAEFLSQKGRPIPETLTKMDPYLGRGSSKLCVWLFGQARNLLMISFVLLPVGAMWTLLAIWSLASVPSATIP